MMLPVPDSDTLRWMAIAAAGGVALAVAIALSQAHKWMVFSSEPDPEPEIDIPDTRESRGIQEQEVLRLAVAFGLTGASLVYIKSLPSAVEDMLFISVAAIMVLRAVAVWLTQDDRAQVVGEAPSTESEKRAVHAPLLFAAANLAMAWFD